MRRLRKKPLKMLHREMLFHYNQPSREMLPWKFKRFVNIEIDSELTLGLVEFHLGSVFACSLSTTLSIGTSFSPCYFIHVLNSISINCIDFSADLYLVAAGSKMSYIQVWSLEGAVLKDASLDANPDSKPVNSKRLIGHSGPVYAVSFAPSAARSPDSANTTDTSPRVLLSSSADKTIRLWSIDA